MDHALGVRRVERFGDLRRDDQGPFDGKRTGLQRIGERFAFEQLHDQEGDAVLIADVVERADGGVIQARDRARLTCETIEMYLFEPPGCGQNLDRHPADRAANPWLEKTSPIPPEPMLVTIS
jgi:hypothetical protein